MERGGPIALSSVGADQDVFLRSNLLFNIWIDNYDVTKMRMLKVLS
ncbi:MAG: hypothetical protein U0T83_05530 [Bacteriovoracaceae bacterium]